MSGPGQDTVDVSFFSPRRGPDHDSEPDPRGWAAYIQDRVEVPAGSPRRPATDLEVVDSGDAIVRIPSVDVHPDLIAFDVVCELPNVRGGRALQALIDDGMEEINGASPPNSGLLVGLELADGTAVLPYPTESPGQRAEVRLELRGGGSSGEDGRASTVRQSYVVTGVPQRPFRIICSFTAVGVKDAAVTVDPSTVT